jgi:acetyltransferase-like isoleucine patch superfamily enzyme
MKRAAVVQLASMLLPWPLRRRVLATVLGYELHPTSRIGFSLIVPKKLVMGPQASIGHMTVCKGIDVLELGAHASIGRGNWITGQPSSDSTHFTSETNRFPALFVGDHSSITNRHIVDCTNTITIGRFSTVAGFRSQFLTHSIDLNRNRQTSGPIQIGNYCFVGTGAVILANSTLPDCSVLGAASLLNKAHSDSYGLYAGVPARRVASVPESYNYFSRTTGYVI